MRRRIDVIAARNKARESQTQLIGFLGPRRVNKKPKAPPSIKDRDWAEAMEQAGDFMRTGDWSEAVAKHFVALYDLMHTRVYGVVCVELGPRERFGVSMKAKTMLEKQFDGNAAAMAEFLRWTWQREEWREKRRREDCTGGSQRLGPWLQFNGAVLTDYRLEMSRRTSRRTG